MSAITAGNVITLGDKLVAEWLSAFSAIETAQGKADDNQTSIASMDPEVRSYLGDAFYRHWLLMDPEEGFARQLAGPFAALKRASARSGLSGVTDLNTFLTYYNIGAGGAWNCLMPPDFSALYEAVHKVAPSPWNVYFEVQEGGTYANALRKSEVTGAGTDTETAGFDIDSDLYAGGVAKFKVSGLTGTGTVSVDATWRKTDGTLATGTGSVNVTGDGDVTITTLPFANALIVGLVTAVTIPAGISAGTLYVEAHPPSGRTNPPT